MVLFGKIEGFVNETQARSDIITTFVTISIVFFGMIIAFALLWSYNKSDRLFFMVFSGMVAVYASITAIFVVIIRSNITSTQFKVFMISSIFIALLSIIVLVIFVVKSSYLFKNIDISNTRSPEPIRQRPPSPSPPPPPRTEIYDENDPY